MASDVQKRFWTKVDKTATCWLWTAAKVGGYGRFRVQDKQVQAHRFAYETLVGPIPEGLTIDHLRQVCGNRHCVKAIADDSGPAHLEVVTMKVNVLRGDGPSAKFARSTHCSEGHPLEQGTRQRFCRPCRNRYLRERGEERRRAAGVPVGRSAWTSRTQCPRGHPYDDANTYITAKGYRRCRECTRQANREAKRQARAKQAATPDAP